MPEAHIVTENSPSNVLICTCFGSHRLFPPPPLWWLFPLFPKSACWAGEDEEDAPEEDIRVKVDPSPEEPIAKGSRGSIRRRRL